MAFAGSRVSYRVKNPWPPAPSGASGGREGKARGLEGRNGGVWGSAPVTQTREGPSEAGRDERSEGF